MRLILIIVFFLIQCIAFSQATTHIYCIDASDKKDLGAAGSGLAAIYDHIELDTTESKFLFYAFNDEKPETATSRKKALKSIGELSKNPPYSPSSKELKAMVDYMRDYSTGLDGNIVIHFLVSTQLAKDIYQSAYPGGILFCLNSLPQEMMLLDSDITKAGVHLYYVNPTGELKPENLADALEFYNDIQLPYSTPNLTHNLTK
ncbi:MAG: hypothetical protein SH856_10480 [Flavobacteriales bacterium]|nr:hypothetical protein [Flavobacteriales bacterium]